MTIAGRLAGVTVCCFLSACSQPWSGDKQSPEQVQHAVQSIEIQLDADQPENSIGAIVVNGTINRFEVGYGKNGIACEGTLFEEGWTPLGRFRVNAVLTADRFEMDPALIRLSGRTTESLRKELFSNMNSIDFDGDGEAGEYGDGYISLAPVPTTVQPFSFNDYDGTFRWYSFAIHGTNNEQKIGKRVTGGCINVNNMSLSMILSAVKIGDEVVIRSNGTCSS